MFESRYTLRSTLTQVLPAGNTAIHMSRILNILSPLILEYLGTNRQ